MPLQRFYRFIMTDGGGIRSDGVSFGGPTIEIKVELPERPEWGDEQKHRLEKLFQEVRSLLQFAPQHP